MDEEFANEVGEIVRAGLESGTPMDVIIDAVGRLCIKKWLVKVAEKGVRIRNFKPVKRK